MSTDKQIESSGNEIGLADVTATAEEENVEPDDQGGIQTSCGWLSWRPMCLNRFANPRWLLSTICTFLFFQGMAVNGLVDGSLASLQRRFELSSFQTGLLPSLYDVVAAIFGVFIAYHGNTRNKARFLTVGIVFIGLGNVVYALPHFTTGPYSFTDSNSTKVCSAEPIEGVMGDDDVPTIAALSGYLYVFILSAALYAIGGSMAYTLGYGFVDESVPSESAGMYLGILSVCAILGPAFGLVLIGVLLSFYTDFYRVEGSLGINQSNVQWVGAWWLGFIFCAIASFIIAVPMSCFPHELPGTRTIRQQRVSQAHAKSDQSGKTNREGFGKTWRDFPSSLRIMARNPTFMAVVAGLTVDGMLLTGVGTFLPIYLENQYGLNSGTANIIVGGLVCTAGGGSLFVGGWLVKRLRLKVRGMLKFVIVTSIFHALIILTVLLTCPEIPLAGVYQQYSNDSAVDVVRLNDTCNNGCHCSTTPYSPVCGSNDVMYFSPCFAGCQSQSVDGNTLVYSDCTCISAYNASAEATAVPGRCGSYCTQMYIFLVCLFFIIVATFIDKVASTNVILRCTPDGQQSFALGVYGLISRLFGSLPGPIIFGSIIDATCTLWHEEDGRRGQCWFHDRTDLSLYCIIFAVTIKSISVVCMMIGYKMYRAPYSAELDGSRK